MTVNDTDDSFKELLKSYKSLIKSYLDAEQNPNLASWNQSLIIWRAFLEVLTQKTSFTDCASLQDCVFALGDDLNDLYLYESDFPRANEIRELLPNITKNLMEMITTNLSIKECQHKILVLDQLLNRTFDTNVLCGVKPEIIFNSGEHRVVLENDTFVLECAAESDTPVTYEWIHKNTSIHQSANGNLTIRNANFSHGGAYQCKASNRKGSVISNVIIISINSKPEITQHPNDTKVYINDGIGLLLRCNATGVPFPTIGWFFVSQHPNSSVKSLPNNNDTLLYYHNITEDDSGYYFCVATNKHGQVKSKKARVSVLNMSPGEPRLGVKVNITSSCKEKEHCSSYNKILNKELGHYSQLFSISLNTSQSQITDFRYTVDGLVAIVSFIYKSSKPEKHDINEPVYDPFLESFARKRTHLVQGLKFFHQKMENGSPLSSDDDNDIEVIGDASSLTAWVVPPGCPRGQEPHSNGYMCVFCSPGTYGKIDGQCEACPIKTYQYHSGQVKCISCDYGFTTKNTGSLSPEECYDMRPSPPQDLRAITIGSRQLEVQWEKPAENSDSVLYYIIKYGLLKRKPRTTTAPKTTTRQRLGGLRKFTDYRIAVFAVNSYGMKKSQIIIKTGEDIPDAAPHITQAIPIRHDSIEVTWKPIPKHQRNGIIRGYRIYFTEDGVWKSYTTPTGNITTCVVPGLQAFTWYCVKMTAFTSKGEYPDWKKTHCRSLKTPSPPIEVSGKALSDTQILLRFSTTSGYSLSNVVNYGEKPNDLYNGKICPTSSCVIEDLKENTLYYIKVLGMNKQIGESASIIQVRTKKRDP